jgi:hypothetical protein
VHHLDAVLVNAADIVASHVSDFIKSNRSPDGQNALERRDHEDSLADITTNKSYAVAAAE